MKPLRVLPAAEAEVAAAATWYESQQTALGVEYVAEVDAAFERVATMPEAFPLWRAARPYRKLRLKRFPFVVFYRVLEEDIEIVAVAHARRRPGYWTER